MSHRWSPYERVDMDRRGVVDPARDPDAAARGPRTRALYTVDGSKSVPHHYAASSTSSQCYTQASSNRRAQTQAATIPLSYGDASHREAGDPLPYAFGMAPRPPPAQMPFPFYDQPMPQAVIDLHRPDLVSQRNDSRPSFIAEPPYDQRTPTPALAPMPNSRNRATALRPPNLTSPTQLIPQPSSITLPLRLPPAHGEARPKHMRPLCDPAANQTAYIPSQHDPTSPPTSTYAPSTCGLLFPEDGQAPLSSSHQSPSATSSALAWGGLHPVAATRTCAGCSWSSLQTEPRLLQPGGSNYFTGARDFQISNLNINNHSFKPTKSVFELLDPYICHGAAHDSSERSRAPMCYGETRAAIRQEILRWIEGGEGENELKRIMWLSGPAGSGKTAIAGSIAESCKKEGLLAATFMFSSFWHERSCDQTSKRGLIVTLAYQISQHESLHPFKVHLSTVLERQPDIFHKNLKEQAASLILKPFEGINWLDRTNWPVAIIIDGLDEVVAEGSNRQREWGHSSTSEEDQLEILEVLLSLAQSPFFPFRIFIASRPEGNITTFFDSPSAKSSTFGLFLDSKYDPDIDIKLFLKEKLANIRRRAGIPDTTTWPSQPDLSRLITMSSGQFIVAVTIIRWIEAGVPQQRLEEILWLGRDMTVSKNPFANVDMLYSHILQRVSATHDDPRLIVKWVVAITSAMSMSPASVQTETPAVFWRQFFEDREGQFNYHMAPIASLVSIPPFDDTTLPIMFHHKSFTDFLSTQARCGDKLYVDETALKTFVSSRIVQVLKHKGPKVPHPSAIQSPGSFLRHFTQLELLTGGGTEHRRGMPRFLFYIKSDPHSRNVLASCDVSWWTEKLLASNYSSSLGAIYSRIHKEMECVANTSLDADDRSLKCYPECINWRKGILEKAKELNWCVHELEEIDLDSLGDLNAGEIESKFKQLVYQSLGSFQHCRICPTGLKNAQSARLAP